MHLQNKNGSLMLSCRFYQTELNNPSELDKVGSACHRFLVFDQMQDSLKYSTLKIGHVCFLWQNKMSSATLVAYFQDRTNMHYYYKCFES